MEAFEAPAMALSLVNCPAPRTASAEIVQLASEDQVTDWTRTCTAAFGFDDALSGWWHELFTSIPFGGTTPLRHFLACIDGEPVGTASAFIEDGVVGLASVALSVVEHGEQLDDLDVRPSRFGQPQTVLRHPSPMRYAVIATR